MAHFAEVDENNVVVRVLVVPDTEEHRGQDYLAIDCGLGGRWIQTSYNNNLRKYFASAGSTYDEQADIFIPPCPRNGWLWNNEQQKWEAPTPQPSPLHLWNDEKQEWEGYE